MAQQIIVLDKPKKGKGGARAKGSGSTGRGSSAGRGNSARGSSARGSSARGSSARGSSAKAKPAARRKTDDGPTPTQATRRGSDWCLPNVPSPNTYKLKTLVGYEDHDPSKWREPAFSMGRKKDELKKEGGPGPKYNPGDVTRFGPKNPLMFSLGKKHSSTDKDQLPGPGNYAPEKYEDPRFRKPPAPTLKSRLKELKGQEMPSPAEYGPPGGIGNPHPTINAAPAAVLMSRRPSKPGFNAPAPNTYGSPNLELTKKAAPQASISGRTADKDALSGPGPAAYFPSPNNTRSPPAFSFGIKRSKCLEPFKEPDSTASLC